jgi:hypothetical protein
LPSIGYAPQAQSRPVSANPARNSGPAKQGSFDQIFTSTARGRDRDADAGKDDTTAASDATGQAPVSKQPAPGQSVAKQPGAPATEVETSASAKNPLGAVSPASAVSPVVSKVNAVVSKVNTVISKVNEVVSTVNPASQISALVEGFSASAVVAAGDRKAEKAPSTGPKRPPASDSPAADPFAGRAAAASDAPLDPSSLAMLLGAARFVNPAAAAPGAPANVTKLPAAESPAGNETEPVTGLAPLRESAAIPAAGLAFALRLGREAPVAPAGDASSEAAAAGPSLSSFAGELEAAAKAITGTKPRDPAESAAGASPAGSAVLETATAAPAGNAPAPSASMASNAAKAEPLELPAPVNEPLRALRVELHPTAISVSL